MQPSPCECSLIIPTRNRRAVLAETLARLDTLPDRAFETIVCDNGSTDDSLLLSGQFPEVRWIALGENLGCAARNVGAAAARGRLLLMLDDDSWPAPRVIDYLVRVFQERPSLGAAALRVRLTDPPHRHDAGGVPGVFFNCGGVVRRRAFLDAGGFPVDFDYYVEEYDLCARLWQAGWRVAPLGDALIWHRRVSQNRSADRMLRLLVRNNLRFWRRYAPERMEERLIKADIDRYQRVAVKENARAGFCAGLEEGRAFSAGPARRRPLTIRQFEGLMGIDAARAALRTWADKHRVKKVIVWTRGKGSASLIELLNASTIHIEAIHDAVDRGESCQGIAVHRIDHIPHGSVDGLVVGSLSCGVAEDIASDLTRRFRGVPVLNPAPWHSAEAHPLAVPA
jgi:GT2 family glycosyltransferase